jgi:integrase/recombinase XerC
MAHEHGGRADPEVALDATRPAGELARRSLAGPAPAVATVGPEDVLGAFLAGRNPRTLKAYDGDLKDFARFLGLSPRSAVVALLSAGHGPANAMALGYRVSLQGRGLSAATVARRLAALRSVVKLARQLGQVAWTLEVQSPRVQGYRDTRGPGDDGWKAMATLARERAEAGRSLPVRDRAILRLAHDLGLRVSELTGLDLADVEDGPEGSAAVWITGKGRSDRERLTLPGPTAAALDAWRQSRDDRPGPLFFRLDRGAGKADDAAPRTRLTDRAVRKLVGALGRKAGLSRPVRPHGLRHHAITRALDKTHGDVRSVQRFSRHADLRTLTVYDDRRRDAAGEVSRLVADDEA